MIGLLKAIFGIGPKADFKELKANGAMIIDVRTKGEYNSGHIKGSKNMPLNNLNQNLSKLKKDQVIITCCASGVRSGSAKSILKSKGFMDVHNGGGWLSLQSKLR